MDLAGFITEYWTYLTIPVVSALVGFGTNWLAVKMMMYPVEFAGIGPIGWQGVVPANSRKMANVVVDHSVKRVLTQSELISRIEPDKLVESLQNRIEPFVEDIVDEVMSETSNYGVRVGNFLWAAAPGNLKQMVYREVKKNLPDVLAIYLIQKPLHPVKIGPFTIQGLFIKRQKEVSRYFGQVFANDLITAEVVMAEVLRTDKSLDQIRDLIQREVNRAIEDTQGILKPLTVLSLGPAEYAKIGTIISERAFREFQNPEKRALQYLDEAFDIEDTVAERVGALPPEEFFELLHPVIAEDEWKLIAVGAVLGLGAGWWQWALLT